MTWIIVGLGNPGSEYDGTRHNTGRMALMKFAKDNSIDEWKLDSKAKLTSAKGAVGKNAVVLVAPDTFMNKSGSAVLKFVKPARLNSRSGGSVKAAEKMVVVYDDLDLPLGVMKVSFDRGSGGHKGVESIMTAVKTKKFARIRIGISPATASGKIKKPQGEEEVGEFILATFKEKEQVELKAMFKKASEALTVMIEEGVTAAMNKCN